MPKFSMEYGNTEAARRSVWAELPESERKARIAAMQSELLRLYDCVDMWLPAMEQLTDSMYNVRIELREALRGRTYTPELDEAAADAAKEELKALQ